MAHRRRKSGRGSSLTGRNLLTTSEVNRYGRPLKGMGQRSGALDGGSLDKPCLLNLTKHSFTDDVCAYVDDDYVERFTLVEPDREDKELILKCHSFHGLPEYTDVYRRACDIMEVCRKYSCRFVWLGGAPYLVMILTEMAKKRNVIPVYSWSHKMYKMSVHEDGSVVYDSYRQHSGWVIMDERYSLSTGEYDEESKEEFDMALS